MTPGAIWTAIVLAGAVVGALLLLAAVAVLGFAWWADRQAGPLLAEREARVRRGEPAIDPGMPGRGRLRYGGVRGPGRRL